MRTSFVITLMMATAMILPGFAGATSLSGKGPVSDQSANPPPQPPPLTKREVVKKYVKTCGKKAAKEANCAALRKEAVEIVKESLHTLGSSAKRAHVPTIAKFFKSDEVVLRIAAADAIGMIGPQDQDVDALASPANDPVPDVRRAVSQAVTRGKGSALSLLAQRTMVMQKTGLTPDVPPDASKFSMPLAPDSTYLFYASDPAVGRLSYVSRGAGDAGSFFKEKAKKGPFKLEEFRQQYRFQLQDEEHALNQAQDAAAKQMEQVKPPDPTNTQAFMDYMGKMQSVSAGRSVRMFLDTYQPELFGTPTVYVLEERRIGQRSYPTRYVVMYHEQALKKPGYRLSWMTVPDSAIKTAQVASLKEQREEEALQAASKKEDEAAKKREAELDALTKKKDEAEKKKFKKGQADLEKELGF